MLYFVYGQYMVCLLRDKVCIVVIYKFFDLLHKREKYFVSVLLLAMS